MTSFCMSNGREKFNVDNEDLKISSSGFGFKIMILGDFYGELEPNGFFWTAFTD